MLELQILDENKINVDLMKTNNDRDKTHLISHYYIGFNLYVYVNWTYVSGIIISIYIG